MITQDELKKKTVLLSDGLHWIQTPKSYPHLMGKRCGGVGKFGSKTYRYVSINNKRYLEHRLVYLWAYGHMPKEIDHIDGNGENNSLRNLRQCTRGENRMNVGLQSNNRSGVKGVSWAEYKNKWRAEIVVNKKTIVVGYFTNLEDAKNAITEARDKYHGQYARHE